MSNGYDGFITQQLPSEDGPSAAQRIGASVRCTADITRYFRARELGSVRRIVFVGTHGGPDSGRRRELHAKIAKAFEELMVPSSSEHASPGATAGLLAHHWSAAEEWEKALEYTVQAAKHAEKLLARPEAINQYWRALE